MFETPEVYPLSAIWRLDTMLYPEELCSAGSLFPPAPLIPLPQYYRKVFCLSTLSTSFLFLGCNWKSQEAFTAWCPDGEGRQKVIWGVGCERKTKGKSWLICILSECPGSIAKGQQGGFWQGGSNVMRCVISQQEPASLPLRPPN